MKLAPIVEREKSRSWLFESKGTNIIYIWSYHNLGSYNHFLGKSLETIKRCNHDDDCTLYYLFYPNGLLLYGSLGGGEKNRYNTDYQVITKDLANIINAHSDTFCLFLQGDQNPIVIITKYQPFCYYSIAVWATASNDWISVCYLRLVQHIKCKKKHVLRILLGWLSFFSILYLVYVISIIF